MYERNLQRTENVVVSVQRFYESKLHAWAFDCQQNQSRRFIGVQAFFETDAFVFRSARPRSS
jgi:hypothetical protein